VNLSLAHVNKGEESPDGYIFGRPNFIERGIWLDVHWIEGQRADEQREARFSRSRNMLTF
jgi:hypothetical protein